MKRFIPILSLIAAMAADAQTPVMTLQVAQNATVTSSETAVVANIDYLHVRAVVAPHAVAGLTRSMATPGYELTVTSTADGKPVATRHVLTGFSVGPEGAWLDIALEIPLDPNERRAIVERYVDDTIRDAGPRERNFLTAQRQQAVAAVERIFVQNRTGDYVLCVQLTNPRIDGAGATIPLRVVDSGTFADWLQSPRPRKAR